jgi:hypothetical protein
MVAATHSAPKLAASASASFAQATAAAPGVESRPSASTRTFDVAGADPTGAQLDRLMLEDSLTRRK